MREDPKAVDCKRDLNAFDREREKKQDQEAQNREKMKRYREREREREIKNEFIWCSDESALPLP